jgi:threonine/homoserine/homoserine lactone efflux protein
MDLGLFLQGLLIGFSISVPVGPVGVLVIRRTLVEGFASGLVSGVGCATGMALYGSVIGFGLTAISDLLVRVQRPLAIVGGLFLVYLGYTIVRAAPPDPTSPLQRRSLLGAYASTLALTIFNPAVILYFLAIFTGSDLLDRQRSYGTAVVLVLGVFLGALGWWLALSGAVSLMRTRLNDRILRWANALSGLAIAAFGVKVALGL